MTWFRYCSGAVNILIFIIVESQAGIVYAQLQGRVSQVVSHHILIVFRLCCDVRKSIRIIGRRRARSFIKAGVKFHLFYLNSSSLPRMWFIGCCSLWYWMRRRRRRLSNKESVVLIIALSFSSRCLILSRFRSAYACIRVPLLQVRSSLSVKGLFLWSCQAVSVG